MFQQEGMAKFQQNCWSLEHLDLRIGGTHVQAEPNAIAGDTLINDRAIERAILNC